MRVVEVAEYGIANITVNEVADPVPAPDEVLVATEATTVNPADIGMVSGAFASFLPAAASVPYTPGWDLAGRVVAVGAGVDPSLQGSRVVGFSPWMEAGHGTQASLVALGTDKIAAAPDSIAPEKLTTIGLNGLTAWRAVDEIDPRAGETVVIAGAAGAVGGFALELAVARGAKVIAAVSERDRDTVLALGAGDVAAREDGDLVEVVRRIAPDGVDAFFNTVNGLGDSGIGMLRDGGRYVTVTDGLPDPERGITPIKVFGGPNAAALRTLVAMTVAGTLHTPVARTFRVADARAAYEEFTAGPHRGRIVLTF